MPRDLQAAVVTQMDATQKRPVLLFELGLSSTLRFVAYNTNLVFPTAGNTYTAKNIQVNNVIQALEGQIGRVTVKFDNVSRDMASYAHNEDFRGINLTIKRVYLDALGNALNFNELFNGYMERPSEITRHWLTVSATSGKPLTKKALTFPYQRMCPWIFGGSKCNTDGLADLTSLTATGTADSGTTSTLVDNALTQADAGMMPGQEVDMNGLDALYISVKIDQDGMVGPAQPGDMEGAYASNPVAPGSLNVDIVIDKVY